MPLSQVTVTLPRGIKSCLKCTGEKMMMRPAYQMRHIQFLRQGCHWWWGLSVQHRQNMMTALGFSFILTINKFPLIRGRKGQREDETSVRKRDWAKQDKKKVTSCVNFYSNSLKGYIKLNHNIQPPWNNLYANKALHMVWAVCSSAGKIFYIASFAVQIYTDVL